MPCHQCVPACRFSPNQTSLCTTSTPTLTHRSIFPRQMLTFPAALPSLTIPSLSPLTGCEGGGVAATIFILLLKSLNPRLTHSATINACAPLLPTPAQQSNCENPDTAVTAEPRVSTVTSRPSAPGLPTDARCHGTILLLLQIMLHVTSFLLVTFIFLNERSTFRYRHYTHKF